MGDSRDARSDGYSPAATPMPIAASMPPAMATGGTTVGAALGHKVLPGVPAGSVTAAPHGSVRGVFGEDSVAGREQQVAQLTARELGARGARVIGCRGGGSHVMPLVMVLNGVFEASAAPTLPEVVLQALATVPARGRRPPRTGAAAGARTHAAL